MLNEPEPRMPRVDLDADTAYLQLGTAEIFLITEIAEGVRVHFDSSNTAIGVETPRRDLSPELRTRLLETGVSSSALDTLSTALHPHQEDS